MKKKVVSLLVGFSFVTVMGSAFAQSSDVSNSDNHIQSSQFWLETAAKRNGDYDRLATPFPYKVTKLNTNPKLAKFPYKATKFNTNTKLAKFEWPNKSKGTGK